MDKKGKLVEKLNNSVRDWRKKPLFKYVLLMLLLAPLVVYLYIVLRYGVNVPFRDEWDTVRLYRDFCENGFNLGKLLSFQVLEHRIPVAVAEQMVIWSFTRMNDYTVLIISSCFLAGTFGLIIRYWNEKKLPILGLIPVPALLFSLKQALATLWPSCNMWFLMVLFSVSSFFCYQRLLGTRKIRWLLLSTICAVLAMFSVANGALIWITYLVIFIVRRLFEREPFFQRDNVAILAVGLLCYILYFYNWQSGISGMSVTSVWQFIITLFPMVFCVFFEPDHLWTAFCLGVLLIALLTLLGCYLCFCCKVKREKKITEHVFPLLLCVFSFGSIICIAYGRGGLTRNMPGAIGLNSWYAVPSVWFMIGAYILLYEFFYNSNRLLKVTVAHRRIDFVFLPCILFVVFFANSLTKVESNIIPRALVNLKCGYMMEHYDDSDETRIQGLSYVFYEDVSDDIEWLKENSLSLFSGETSVDDKLKNLTGCKAVEDPTEGLQMVTAPRTFWVDLINGEGWQAETHTTTADGVFFSGWALDDINLKQPYGLYCMFRGQYYQILQSNRVDIWEYYYGNAEEPMCGFEGWLPLDDCPDGSYPLDIVILCDQGKSYFKTTITTVIVGNAVERMPSSQTVLQPEERNPTEGLTETDVPHTFWVDAVNGAAPAVETQMTTAMDFSISGWALDDPAESAAQAVYLQFGKQYYELRQTNRADVCQVYFGNSSSPMCGFSGRLSLDACPPGEYPVSLVVICDGSASYLCATVTNVIVS